MIKVIKKEKQIEVNSDLKKTRKDSRAYHNELKKISDNFIGIVSENGVITRIVVDTNTSSATEQQLNTKLQDLIDNPNFGVSEL